MEEERVRRKSCVARAHKSFRVFAGSRKPDLRYALSFAQ